MMRILLILGLFFLLIVPAESADLYKVTVRNEADADILSSLGQDVILRLPDGYLLLSGPTQERYH